MSTDAQDLSPEIQKQAIGSYAVRKRISIVETFADEGRSGVTLEKRPAMKRLLLAAANRERNFSIILVYDVTRWGRFRDPDASAYYEYHCRLHGVDVRYVEEPFLELDSSPIVWMFKGMKRFMAAEFSRELSVKTTAGQVTAMNKGFQLGTLPCLGVSRIAVQKSDGAKRHLGPVEHKAGRREHVKWTSGPEHELHAIRRIFELYARTETSVVDLARQLEREGLRTRKNRVVSEWMLYSFLRSESVLGNFVWGRAENKKRRSENHERFHRVSGVFEPVVSRELFDAVQAKLGRRSHVIFTKEILVQRLRAALDHDPNLRAHQLQTHGCPCRETYIRHFGSMQMAWEAAGATYPTRPAPGAYLDMERSAAAGAEICSRVAALLRSAGVDCKRHTRVDRRGQTLLINGHAVLRVQVIWKRQRYDGWQWELRKVYKKHFDHVLVVRLRADLTPVDSLLLTRDHYFASDRWLQDDLTGSWRFHECMEDVARLIDAL
jgi:DNA invertase Pin-like site-specific DNA recombinase